MSHQEQNLWEEHHHEAIIHSHEHHHVTHNYNQMTGGYDHLSSIHVHEHDHNEVRHVHYPHQDFAKEHQYEAHIHDHDVPVKASSPARGQEAIDLTADEQPAKPTRTRTTRSRTKQPPPS